MDWVQPTPKKEKKDYSGPRSAQPMYIYYIYLFIIIYNIIIYKKQKFSNKKNFKNLFKKIVIFSNIFLPILHNIGLYIYIVKYKSSIKIPGFLLNIFLKKIKTFLKNIKNF